MTALAHIQRQMRKDCRAVVVGDGIEVTRNGKRECFNIREIGLRYSKHGNAMGDRMMRDELIFYGFADPVE